MQTQEKDLVRLGIPLSAILFVVLVGQFYLFSSHPVVNANTTSNTQNVRVITVTGAGTVNVQPDRAVLTIGVITQNTSAQIAAERNAEIMSRLIASLVSLGINRSEIRTIHYSISPAYDSCCGQKVAGYIVTNQIQVTVLNKDNVTELGMRTGQVIDAATSAGANILYGIEFTSSDSSIQSAKIQALTLAAQDAASQANSLARALGVNITGVVSASPGFSIPYPVPVYASGSASTPVVPPSTITVSVSLTVTYSIS